jgi:hypothetical protein
MCFNIVITMNKRGHNKMDAIFTARLVQIGNSTGIIIPHQELEQRKVGDKVKVHLVFLDEKNGDKEE